MGDGVRKAVRGAVQVFDAVQHRVDMGFEEAELVVGAGAGEAGIELALGHAVGVGVDAVDPLHDAAGGEPADEAAREQEGAEEGEDAASEGRKGVIDRLQAAGDEKGEATRKLARDGEPAGLVFGEFHCALAGEGISGGGKGGGPILAGSGEGCAVAVHQEEHFALRGGCGAGVDGLAQRDDAALVVKGGEAVQVGGQQALLGGHEAGFDQPVLENHRAEGEERHGQRHQRGETQGGSGGDWSGWRHTVVPMGGAGTGAKM